MKEFDIVGVNGGGEMVLDVKFSLDTSKRVVEMSSKTKEEARGLHLKHQWVCLLLNITSLSNQYLHGKVTCFHSKGVDSIEDALQLERMSRGVLKAIELKASKLEFD